MNTINYDKYSTMSINQLVAALTNAEKKQAKIEEKLKQELSEIKELAADGVKEVNIHFTDKL